MKNIIKLFLLCFTVVTAVGCSSGDDKFSGSPLGHQNIVTLKGSITTDVVSALQDQKVNFTAHLPEGKVFSDTVSVEVSAFNKSGGRTRTYVIFLPGETSKDEEISSPGGVIFDTSFDLQITAIKLYKVEEGTHYLMTSDPVSIATGSSGIPATDSDRLTVRLVWENGSSSNNVRLFIDKPDPAADVNVTTFTSGGKVHYITKTYTGSNNPTYSKEEGDYIFSITGITQTTPVDLTYRIIVVYPNGDSQVFQGVYQGLVGGATPSPLKAILKVNKTGEGAEAVFTVTTDGL